jgi:hypothetical protein
MNTGALSNSRSLYYMRYIEKLNACLLCFPVIKTRCSRFGCTSKYFIGID